VDTEYPVWVQRIVSEKISTNTGIELVVVLVVCVGRGRVLVKNASV
jgi:hypothetical protein